MLSNATNGALIYNGGADGSYSARGRILNDDGWSKAGAVWIEDASVVEGDSGVTQMTFTVRRGGGSGAFSVNYTSADSDAGASDGDYTAVAGKLNFGAGVENQTITVAVKGDLTVERGDEYLSMLLFDATNGATILDSIGSGLIRDDDIVTNAAEGTLSISNGNVTEGNDGTRSMVFTVERTGSGAFTVNYKTADGTAIAGSDYVGASGTLSFAPGETSKTISVAINGDTEYEKDQSFFVFLFGAPETVTVANGLATGVIVNDDPQMLAPDRGYVSRGPVMVPGSYLLANDPPGMTLAGVSNAMNGSAAMVAGGAQFDATDSAASTVASFAYTAFDGTVASHPAQVSLNVMNTGAGSNKLTIATLAGEFSVIDGLGGSDQLVGGAGRDRFLGGAGNDRLSGGQGNDALFGGDGADKLDGGTGVDFMYGGAGDDTYFVDGGDLVSESSTFGIDDGGKDTVFSSVNSGLASFIENLTLTGTAISGGGNNLDNVITGNAAANQLFGGDGADTLNGGAGDDVLRGGEDGDTYIVSAGDIIDDQGSSGVDKATATGSYALSWYSGIDILSLAPSSTGNAALTGDDGNNKIVGNLGKNVLDGRGGDDLLLGGDGDDRLIGSWGRDAMTGGAGADVFAFRSSDSLTGQIDSITDFVSGTDKIDLELVPAKGLAAASYAAASVASNRSSDALAAASIAAGGGDKSVVFVAGETSGWLFWSSDSDRRTLEEGVRLDGLNSLSAFQRTDLT